MIKVYPRGTVLSPSEAVLAAYQRWNLTLVSGPVGGHIVLDRCCQIPEHSEHVL